MASLPQPIAPDPATQTRTLPDYVPARMLNEFVYCPRLFYYEWVEGLFRASADTEAGKLEHKRVDREDGKLPAAEEIGSEKIHSRSATLASSKARLIARLDLVEVEDGVATPVDYSTANRWRRPTASNCGRPTAPSLRRRASSCATTGIARKRASFTMPRRASGCA
jgi:hypothetical protein